MFGQGLELSAWVCMCTTGQFIQTVVPKVPCVERKHISFPKLSGSSWSKTNTEYSYTSLSTSGAYETGFIAEPYTKGQIWITHHMDEVIHRPSSLSLACETPLDLNTLAAIKMVFPSRVFIEIRLPKRGRRGRCAGLQWSGRCPFLTAGTGGKWREREIEAKSARESGTERDAVSRSVETFSGGGKPSAALQQPAGEREVKEVA